MSGFLSNKFLQYHGLLGQKPKPIEHDLLCPACGYNLRGLFYGRNCPECGRKVTRHGTRPDPLTTGDSRHRQTILIGLTLAAIAPAAAAALRIGYSIGWAMLHQHAWKLPVSITPKQIYFTGAGMIALLWAIGVWLALPRDLDKLMPRLSWLRRIARNTQMLWVVSYVLLIVAEALGPFSPQTDTVLFYALVVGVPAKLGALLAGVMFLRLAEEAELDDPAKLITISLWIVPLLSVIAWVMPLEIWWFGLALILLPLLGWAWYMLTFTRALWSMRQHVSWANWEAGHSHDREGRIAQVRSELEREAQAIVRPLPRSADVGDVPLEGSGEEVTG